MDHPAVIGSIPLASPWVLAPLAGYTDLPFRLLCRRWGAGLCYTEMVSCHGLVYDHHKTKDLLVSCPADRPLAAQLFGGDPEVMGRAAAVLQDFPVDLVDINMGCPVRKVVKRGAGAALLRDPQRALAVMDAVRENAGRPVTIKIRLGWTDGDRSGIELAAAAVERGIAAVAVHGRTWAQGFGGTVDWDGIRAVKEAVGPGVPVIGNGDVTSLAGARAMMAATGCDLVMIGRGALGAPWVFTDQPVAATAAARLTVAREHLELIRRYRPHCHPAVARNHLARYCKGFAGAAVLRQRLGRARDLETLATLLDPSFCQDDEA